jgi:hypothetical protein
MKDRVMAFLAQNSSTVGIVALIVAAVFMITNGGTQ